MEGCSLMRVMYSVMMYALCSGNVDFQRNHFCQTVALQNEQRNNVAYRLVPHFLPAFRCPMFHSDCRAPSQAFARRKDCARRRGEKWIIGNCPCDRAGRGQSAQSLTIARLLNYRFLQIVINVLRRLSSLDLILQDIQIYYLFINFLSKLEFNLHQDFE